MKVNEIKELLLTIDKTNLTYVNLKDENFILEVSKGEIPVNTKTVENKKEELKLTEVSSAYDEANKEEASVDLEVSNDNIHVIKAPIMGTYYEASGPESSTFVKVGDKVSKGDTLCIIEAMKLMNEINSDVDGEVVDILVSNEDLVEYNQAIFKIKTI
ncbi:acetyl-CoA carboxylase biotin carboxyl carrier protein [Paraclostridium bifermentans]|jgi:acetyl-CoA carboxylase biotin carboxyl carrier protein|uniref:Biotin carboxyl carrier protein of acetyl-CoA carboxylase n=1 Tax=Paraclostridium bifermentans TaxID=1490 RepID=A0A5P3XDF1_PARBF|nr:acetyl-CoA carboxylase biotin carboxyl carrier protein [Paraclostridium bifermentans]RDC50321.1 acetyl-CoA carboxylase biotin carboxyl carrier protein [Acinetobacter sp. RIT592]MBU5286675.1 acetyl-CoA carboxylase biotin carboxyl carrier protein [Paraclostridium bifermentans]MCR1874400.1 acetyl-CoA carboxylase biotin carboxyl carrier protein [Paraclostridium bifermentans]MDU3337056.1 acetyl-CoA carboxylase biotin carboxyl carrier protein [Paraclostridium bifermentans]QEZ67693.1 acetyl-CoA ca